MKTNRKTIRGQACGASALELLEAHLKTPAEAEWYAQRLGLLGRASFGDLWESSASEPAGTKPVTL